MTFRVTLDQPLDWLQILTFAVALVALGVSVWSLLRSGKEKSRDILLDLHLRMVDVHNQRGRRLIFQISEAATQQDKDWLDLWFALSPEDRDAANQPLSYFDILGVLAERGDIDSGFAIDLWGNTIRRMWDAALPYIEFRRRQTGTEDFWDGFEWLKNQVTLSKYGASMSTDSEGVS